MLNQEYVTQYGNVTEAGLLAGLKQERVFGGDYVRMYAKKKTFVVEVEINGQYWTTSSRSYRIASNSYYLHDTMIAKRERLETELIEAQNAISASSEDWHFESVLDLFKADSEQYNTALKRLAVIAKALAESEAEVEKLNKQLEQAAEVAEYTPDVVRILGSLEGVEIPGYWGRFIDPAHLRRQLEPYVALSNQLF